MDKINITRLMILLLIFIINATTALKCEYRYKKTCYQILDQKYPFSEGENACFMHGGTMVKFKNIFLTGAPKALKVKGIKEAFIGLSDSAQRGIYRWNDKSLYVWGDFIQVRGWIPRGTQSCVIITDNKQLIKTKCEDRHFIACQKDDAEIIRDPKTEWTSWMWEGDIFKNQLLTLENLRKKYTTLCPEPTGVECRSLLNVPIEKARDTFAMPCSKTGLICNNADQWYKFCTRYMIRFRCPKDVNECKEPGMSKCDPNARCINTYGSYKCVCKFGFSGDGFVCYRIKKCIGWGDPHYITFDRATHHYMGICSYIFAKSCLKTAGSKLENFTIVQSNEHRGRNKLVSFAKSITLIYKDFTVTLGKKKLYINDIEVRPPQKRTVGDVTITMDLLTKGLHIKTSFGVWITYDGVWTIKVGVPDLYKGQMCGLCGNMDGNIKNDWLMKDGKIAENSYEWGNSWMSENQKDENCKKINTTLPNNICDKSNDKIVKDKCNVMVAENGPFAKCHGLIDPQTIYPACYFDLCTDPLNKEMACQSYKEYADNCADNGVLIDWRSKTKCEVKCGPNEHYESQTSACQSSCKFPNAESECSYPDVDGCVCDDGYLRNGEKCEKKENCGCYDKKSNYRKIGDVWFGENCTVKHRCNGQNEIVDDNRVQCHQHGECFAVPGTFDFECRCKKGFEGQPDNCTDIDECSRGNHACNDDAVCKNELGKYSCQCNKGFTGDGLKCNDVNECDNGTAKCSSYATCHNTRGSYKCVCNKGYEGNGLVCTGKVTEAETEEHKGCSFHRVATCHEIAECIDFDNKTFTCSCPEGATGDGYKGLNQTGCKYAACPLNTFGQDGYCYSFITGKNNMEESQKICRTLGGNSHLATFIDEMNQNFIREKLSIFRKNNPLYLGFSSRLHKDSFLPVDNAAVNYNNWGKNQPNIANKCTVIMPHSDSDAYKFKTVDCQKKYEAICKFPASPRKCPHGWREIDDGKKCVTLFKRNMTAPEAAIECGRFGGDLASIRSDTEYAQIRNRLLKFKILSKVWFGLNKNLLTRSSKPVWTPNGDAVEFSKVNQSTSVVSGTDLECYAVQVNGGDAWVGVNCYDYLPGFLCERPPNVFKRCMGNADYFNGKCYRSVKPKTANESEDLCNEAGGNLVSIVTEGEQAYVEKYMASKELSVDYWIGLTEDHKINGKYSWEDTSTFEYSNWNQGEPSIDKPDNCVVVSYIKGSNRRPWSEKKCTEKYMGLCEYLNTPCKRDDECHTKGECHLGQCRCKVGFHGNGLTICENINECMHEEATCKKNEVCVDTPGSYICNCKENYVRSADGLCQHKLFCKGDSDCANNGKCFNERCSCNPGFEGDGKVKCEDIDECSKPELNKCVKNSICTNIPGDYTCKCKHGYHGDALRECHLAARTCHEYLQKHPTSKSGVYFLDPDQEGPMPAVEATCEMRWDIGITIITHDSVPLKKIKEPIPGSEDRPITYEFPVKQIKPIVDISDFCYQDMVFQCEGSMNLIKTTSYFDVNGKQHKKWGTSTTENMCGCGEYNLCSNANSPCFCDGTNKDKMYDNGRIIDKKLLPLTKIVTGGANRNGKGYISIGPLKCGPKPFDIPTDCHDSYRNYRQRKDATIWIDVDQDGPLAPFVVLCDVNSRPVGITIVPHDKVPGSDPKTDPSNLPGPLKDPKDPNKPGDNCVSYPAGDGPIAKLIAKSGACHQEVKHKCQKGAKLLQNKAFLRTSSGKKLDYFGSSSQSGKCACGQTGSCADPAAPCNCDGKRDSTDFGFIKNKEDLPLKCLVDNNSPPSPSSTSIGPLVCAPGPFGMEPSCHEWLKRGYDVSYAYLIDPDGGNLFNRNNNEDAFLVVCVLTPNPPEGITKIPIKTLDEECEPNSILCKQPVTYPLTPKQIKPIIDRSAYCKQRITYECRVMTLLKPYKSGQPNPFAYWVTYGQGNIKDSKNQYHFFAGDGRRKNESAICQCGIDKSCVRCHCDVPVAPDGAIKTDDGYITDKNRLPIGAVWIGQDKSVLGVVSKVTVGDLECYETFPNCHELKRGFRWTLEKRSLRNGFHSLDPDGPGPRPPIVIKCVNGVTIVPAEMKPTTIKDTDPDNIGPKKQCFDIKYSKTLKPRDLEKLTDNSAFCRQYLRLSCRSTPLTGYVTWYSRDGVEMKGWAGNNGGKECACGEVDSCHGNTSLACNCDAMSTDMLIDHGLLVDKSVLPVSRICFGLTEKKPPYPFRREINIKVEPMECTPKVTDVQPDCQRLRENQYSDRYRKNDPKSEAWIIDPDGNGPNKPFTTYCSMKDVLPVGETEVRVRPDPNKLCTELPISSEEHTITLDYLAITKEQIANLTAISTHCEQRISYECVDAPLFDGTKFGAYGFDGKYINYWLGPNDNSACNKDSCQCNRDKSRTQSDSGKFTDKSILPLTKLVLPKVAGRRRICVHELRCYNIPKTCDGYAKQSRLGNSKGNRNNIWAIDADNAGGETYFGVKCRFNGRTTISETLNRPDPENTDSKKTPDSTKKIPYHDTNLVQLKKLIEVSPHCQQRMDYTCQSTGSLSSKANSPIIYFGNKNEKLPVWAGADFYNATSGCSCKLLGNCPASEACRCDARKNVKLYEGGLFTNKKYLPLSKIQFGRNQNVEASLYSLKCATKYFDFPTTCDEAYGKKYVQNTELLIQPSSSLPPFLVWCDQESQKAKRLRITVIPTKTTNTTLTDNEVVVEYPTTDVNKAKKLVEKSKYCMQPVKITCNGNSLSSNFEWNDGQNKVNKLMGTKIQSQCPCGKMKNCAAKVGELVPFTRARKCNCDSMEAVADAWIIDDKNILPIRSLKIKGTTSKNRVTVGPLMCSTSKFEFDECKHNFHDCNIHATCTNLRDGYKCSCNAGWQGLGGNEIYANGHSCPDNDECKLNMCPSTADCVNTPGSFICNCHKGFKKVAPRACLDINECAVNPSICDKNAFCTNTFGSYYCTCKPGFMGSGLPGQCEAYGTCHCWGDPHCQSFDGRWMHYQGRCKYTLAQDGCKNGIPDSSIVRNESNFEVVMKNWNLNNIESPATWAKEITVSTKGYVIKMKLGKVVTVNGQKVTLPFVPKNPDGTSKGIQVSFYGRNLKLTTNNGLEVKWDGISFVQVSIGEKLRSRVCGLCGNFNKKASDDWIIGPKCDVPGEKTSLLNLFGDSWRNDNPPDDDKRCPQNQCRKNPNEKPCDGAKEETGRRRCEDIRKRFKKCEDVMKKFDTKGLENFVESCVYDYCHTDVGDITDTICKSAESVAESCLENYKVNINFRDKNFCAVKCDKNMEYKKCVPPCQQTCVNSTDALMKCDSIKCKEGCVCVSGYVMENGKCIKPEECGCKMSNGIYFKDGESRTNKNCTETCTCNRKIGQLKCNKISCSADAVCGFKDDDYKCHCKDGYMGDGITCSDIDECSKTPKVCHKKADCKNSIGSYKCTCQTGYEGNGLLCNNINECELTPPVCDEKTEDCFDKIPGHECRCKKGLKRNPVTGKCEDVNECEDTGNMCDRVSTICNNTYGNYRCECKNGFVRKDNESFICRDVNECKVVHECDKKFAKCTNTPGSYYCTCDPGYEGDGKTCTDVDECKTKKVCQYPGATCSNLPGSYECRCADGSKGCDGDDPCKKVTCSKNERCYLGKCVCSKGYKKNKQSGKCEDIDECTMNNHDCAEKNAECVNLDGGYQCKCLHGFRQDPNTDKCENINECTNGIAHCNNNAECVDTPGGYFCRCKMGYTGHCEECRDIDECAIKEHNCHPYLSECTNTPGSYACRCKDGYSGDGKICFDKDECQLGVHNCSGSQESCINTVGGYECRCVTGYTKNKEGRCVDLNECLLSDNGCDKFADCINKVGTYDCECKDGFTGSGRSCKPKGGRVLCDETLCSLNMICEQGKRCKCPLGFKEEKGSCQDIDECTNSNVCDPNSVCLNTQGSFICYCKTGFVESGRMCLNASTISKVDKCNLPDYCIDGSCIDGECTCSEGHTLRNNRCYDDRCSVETCPLDSMCSTRSGSVECICPPGTEMSSDSSGCEDINECEDNMDDCQLNSICVNKFGTYECKCESSMLDLFSDGKVCIVPETQNCGKKCPVGQVCRDGDCHCLAGLVEEKNGNEVVCKKKSDDCKPGKCPENSKCVERLIGYKCNCPSGFTPLGVKSCIDIDECVTGKHNCSTNEVCVNKPGLFECNCKVGYKRTDSGTCEKVNKCNCGPHGVCDKQNKCICKPGYESIKDEPCTDIDECKKENTCHVLANCINTPGSYSCSCPSNFYGDPVKRCIENKCANNALQCPKGEVCTLSLYGSVCVKRTCSSKEILVGDECKPVNDLCRNKKCGLNAVCRVVNEKPACYCDSGYVGDGDSCIDVDECSTNEAECPKNSYCQNRPGTYFCQCNAGFERKNSDDRTKPCTDINECNIENSCAANARCTNMVGFYICQCNPGYKGDGKFSCIPDSKCDQSGGCHSNARCVYNSETKKYGCKCNSGYSGDGVNECIKNNKCFENGKSRCHKNAICKESNTTYRCICPSGFQGDGYMFCEDVDECVDPTLNKCKPLEKCVNSFGGYSCVCGAGAKLLNGICSDINECELQLSNKCSSDADCINTQGSYTCKCKDGFYGDGVKCKDINECIQGLANCNERALCVNKPGSFDCQCQAGALGNGTDCDDEDECKPKGTQAAVAQCDPNAECVNENPGYTCNCKAPYQGTGWFCAKVNPCDKPKACSKKETCKPSDDYNKAICSCKKGFQKASDGSCVSIEHCKNNLDNCNRTSEDCVQLTGGFKCECKSGFKKVGKTCEDKNECDPNSPDFAGAKCASSGGKCKNAPGGFVCVCPSNNEVNKTNQECIPINPCDTKTDSCDRRTEKCIKKVDSTSYTCQCIEGHEKKDGKCVDIDECENKMHDCRKKATCVNTVGSYKCVCPKGTKPAEDEKSCTDRNECQENPFVCGDFAKCVNTDGSYKCDCVPGYQWNGASCEDIDECANKTHPCHEYAKCSNVPGSCKCKCLPGYRGDGIYKCEEEDSCPSTANVKCPTGSHCVQLGKGSSYTCDCNSGYAVLPGQNCVGNVCYQNCSDINECITKAAACQPKAKCVNKPGGYACECPAELQGDGKVKCEDRNECADNTHKCNVSTSECVNLNNVERPTKPYECKCFEGYIKMIGTEICVNKNECLNPTENNCTANSDCIDTVGSYQCKCKPGYQKMPGDQCKDVDECEQETDQCPPKSKCQNTVGSYKCICDSGYQSVSSNTSCTDINECTNPLACSSKPNSNCINTPGSFLCVCPNGFKDQGNSCEDINECRTTANACSAGTNCVNTVGSFRCDCKPQMRQLPNGECEQINECMEGLSKCEQLNGPNSTCVDLPQGYSCLCPKGYINDPETPQRCIDDDECQTQKHNCLSATSTCVNTIGSFNCKCLPGFIKSSTGTCKDINECDEATKRGSTVCAKGGKCVNTIGSYLCKCDSGYETINNDCQDIDECSVDKTSAYYSGCDTDLGNSVCINTPGSFKCTCKKGYTLNSTTKKCQDIDECSYPGTCDNGKCNNLPGSYQCLCLDGYKMVNGRCEDINECRESLTSVCGPSDSGYCFNTKGSYECRCYRGFTNSDTNVTKSPCEKVNECVQKNITCHANADCVVQRTGYKCICTKGYREDALGICRNINECAEDNSCHYLATCTDTDGAFECKCQKGYKGDGKTNCETVCKPTSCPTGSLCQVLENGVDFECNCKCQGSQCTIEGAVCDNDGVNHPSLRSMIESNCEQGKNTTVDYFHECKSSCDKVTCPPKEICSMINGNPKCKCPKCTPEEKKLKTVCASNNVQFQSMCHLKDWVCLTKDRISHSYDGPCKRPVDCTVSDWTSWSRCSKSCGIGQESRQRKVLTKAKFNGKCDKPLKESQDCYNGPCPGDECEKVNCPPYAMCEKGECRCPTCQGLKASDAVCGKIGNDTSKTYGSLCAMKHFACIANKTMTYLHKGECGEHVPSEPKICSMITVFEYVKSADNCTSTETLRTNKCGGGCGKNPNYCCRALKTRSIRAQFRCPDNSLVYKEISSILSCHCKLETSKKT